MIPEGKALYVHKPVMVIDSRTPKKRRKRRRDGSMDSMSKAENPYCVFGDHGDMPFHETNEHVGVSKVSSRVYPSLERKPGKQNWVDHAGGLPDYIERIAKHLHYERGFPIGRAIATAVNRCRLWAAGGGGVNADTRAKAQKALAQWEAKKKKGSRDD